jgi:hypothetical protein
MSTLFLSPSVRSNFVTRIASSAFAQCRKHFRRNSKYGSLLAALLYTICIAATDAAFANDVHSNVKPGVHFYLNTKDSFGCFSKKALLEHVMHLKMGNDPKAKKMQEDDVGVTAQCFTLYGERLVKTVYVVVDLESVSGVDDRVVGFDFADKPENPPPFYTLIKYVSPAQIHNSPGTK